MPNRFLRNGIVIIMTIGAVEAGTGDAKNVLTGKTSMGHRTITDVQPPAGRQPRIHPHIMHKVGHTMAVMTIREGNAGDIPPAQEVAAAVDEVEEDITIQGENIIHRNREGGNEAAKEETIAVDRISILIARDKYFDSSFSFYNNTSSKSNLCM
jgi:hypothetical protein